MVPFNSQSYSQKIYMVVLGTSSALLKTFHDRFTRTYRAPLTEVLMGLSFLDFDVDADFYDDSKSHNVHFLKSILIYDDQ